MSKGMEISVVDESWFNILARQKRELKFADSLSNPHDFIAVFGGAGASPDTPEGKAAYDIGKAIAESGAIVMNGGNSGMMEFSAAGARSVGGTTVGITCENLPGKANRYLMHEWSLERWDQRLLSLVFLADGYVVMPGSSGTLVEISMVIETQNKGFIPARPVVCWGEHWKPVVERIPEAMPIVKYARSAEQVIQLLVAGC